MSKKIISLLTSLIFVLSLTVLSVTAIAATEITSYSYTGSNTLNSNNASYGTVTANTVANGLKGTDDVVYKIVRSALKNDWYVGGLAVDKRIDGEKLTDLYIETEFMLGDEKAEFNVNVAYYNSADTTSTSPSNWCTSLVTIDSTNGMVVGFGLSSEKLCDVSAYTWHKIKVTYTTSGLKINFDDKVFNYTYADTNKLKNSLARIYVTADIVGTDYSENTSYVYIDNLKSRAAFTNSSSSDKADILDDVYENTVNTGSFDYKVDANGNATILGIRKNDFSAYLPADGTLEIPASYMTYPVTVIGEYAFSRTSDGTNETSQTNAYNDVIKKLVLNEPLKEIKDYGFNGLNYNTEIITPDTLETVGTCGLAGHTRATKIVLNEGLKSVGMKSFSWANNVVRDEIVIPSTLTTIGNQAFRGTYTKKLVIKGDIPLTSTQIFGSNNKLAEVIIEDNITGDIADTIFDSITNEFKIFTTSVNVSKLAKVSVAKDKKMYTAKIDVANGNYTARVFDDITAKVIVANYTDNEATSINAPVDVTKAAPVTANYSDGMGIFVWEDMSTLKPLCPAYK